jgi:hypothetical protein
MKQFIAIVVILIVAAVAFLIITMKPREITPKDIHPVPGLVTNVSDTPAVQTPVAGNQPVEEASMTLPSQASEPAEKIVPPKGSQEDIVHPGGNYFIVINSFRNLKMAREKADNLRKKLNSEIYILPLSDDGLYRLSYGKYETREDAERALINVRINIRPEAWIYSTAKAK